MSFKEINPGIEWYRRWPHDVAWPAKKVEPDLVFIGEQLPIDSEGNVVGIGNIKEQTRCALTRFKECVEQAGGSMDDVCEIQSLHTDVRQIPDVLEAAREFFKNNRPTWNTLTTAGLYKAACDVSFSGLAVLNADTRDINPGLEWYNQPPWDIATPCKVANDLVIMGQMCGMDEKGRVIAPGDPRAQSRFAFQKTIECIEAAGGTSENIIDAVFYQRDRRTQFSDASVAQIAQDFLIKDKNTRAVSNERISGTGITMPGFFHQDILRQHHIYGVLGEAEQIPLGGWITFSQYYPLDISWPAIKVGRYVFFSGQVMFDELFFESTLEVDVPSVKKQTRHAFNEYQRVLSTVGATMDNVAFITAFTSVPYMDAVLEVAHEFFRNAKPAWTSVGHRGLFLPQHLVEIYGMAIL